jgi:hypothetical protein
MGILEQVIQMREQGMPDQDIASQLQEQGASPRAINDALNQANIKSAVNSGMEDIAPGMQYNAEDVPTPQGGERYVPSTQESSDDFYSTQSQSQIPPTRGSQEYFSQEPYPQESYAGANADTMIEIAQQVFSEKMKKIQNQIDGLNEFKTIYSAKTDSVYERLKRIESIIDRLQSSILEKVGEYGQGIESVKKELTMMQDTYGKIVDAVSEKHHHTQTQSSNYSESSAEPVHHHTPEHSHAPEHHHTTHHVTSKPRRGSKKKR